MKRDGQRWTDASDSVTGEKGKYDGTIQCERPEQEDVRATDEATETLMKPNKEKRERGPATSTVTILA